MMPENRWTFLSFNFHIQMRRCLCAPLRATKGFGIVDPLPSGERHAKNKNTQKPTRTLQSSPKPEDLYTPGAITPFLGPLEAFACPGEPHHGMNEQSMYWHTLSQHKD